MRARVCWIIIFLYFDPRELCQTNLSDARASYVSSAIRASVMQSTDSILVIIQRNTFNAFPILLLLFAVTLKLPVNSCWCSRRIHSRHFSFHLVRKRNDVRVNRIDAACNLWQRPCINALALCCCVMLMRWGTSTVIMRAQNETPSHEFFIAKMINVEWLQWLRWQPLPLALFIQLEDGSDRVRGRKRKKECVKYTKQRECVIGNANETNIKLKQRTANCGSNTFQFFLLFASFRFVISSRIWAKEFPSERQNGNKRRWTNCKQSKYH